MKEKDKGELTAILTAIYCINQTSEHTDNDIATICDYAFRRFLGANTNLLTLCCIQRTKEALMPEITQILDEATNYKKYMEDYRK